MALVFTVGIAHGSVDNVLYLKKTAIKPLKFYFIYLLLVGAYAFTWFVFPIFSLALFLLISAYHFGQSQLVDCFKQGFFLSKLLYLAWGVALLSALISIKQVEIVTLLNSYEDLQIFAAMLNPEYIQNIHIGTTVLSVAILVFLAARGVISSGRIWLEFFILILINVSFAALPALLGFTMYFIFLHSLKVLEDEFNFLKSKERTPVLGFIKKLIPNTAISGVATALIFAGIYLGFINFSYGFVLLVLISSITFPHAFVMEKFYDSGQ